MPKTIKFRLCKCKFAPCPGFWSLWIWYTSIRYVRYVIIPKNVHTKCQVTEHHTGLSGSDGPNTPNL